MSSQPNKRERIFHGPRLRMLGRTSRTLCRGADLTKTSVYLPVATASATFTLSRRKQHGFDVKAAFRVAGKTPQLWHPESGEVEPVSYTAEQGQTVVPLHFDAQGSVFVVFEGSGAGPSRSVAAPKPTVASSMVRGN